MYEPGLDLLHGHRTGVPGPVLGHKRWTSSPLQVLNFRGLVWTAGTVLPVLPIPASLVFWNPFNLGALSVCFKDDVVNVRIPRFRIKTEARITEALQSLGVTDIFDPSKSDLHLLAPNSNLHLSSVAHK